jgi:hypothetical protein
MNAIILKMPEVAKMLSLLHSAFEETWIQH